MLEGSERAITLLTCAAHSTHTINGAATGNWQRAKHFGWLMSFQRSLDTKSSHTQRCLFWVTCAENHGFEFGLPNSEALV